MYYFAADMHQLEKENKLRVILENQPILLTLFEGKAYAMTDKCPHMGGTLSKGTFVDGKVICPVHHAQFDIKTGEVDEKAHILFMRLPTKKVATYPVKIEKGKLYVDL
ncbi:MAG: Rieske (2Fe-2S) protein [bacterium]